MLCRMILPVLFIVLYIIFVYDIIIGIVIIIYCFAVDFDVLLFQYAWLLLLFFKIIIRSCAFGFLLYGSICLILFFSVS